MSNHLPPQTTGKRYKVEYKLSSIALVYIDPVKSKAAIKKMVNRHALWLLGRPHNDQDDHIQTWLKMLGMHIVCHGAPPPDVEGWYPFDGSHGINLIDWREYNPDELDFTITEEEPS